MVTRRHRLGMPIGSVGGRHHHNDAPRLPRREAMIRMVTEVSPQTSNRPWRRALLWGIGLSLAGRLVALALGLLLWETDQAPAGPDYREPHELDVAPVMGPITGWATGTWQRHDTLLYL
jgi:hypothetical protein